MSGSDGRPAGGPGEFGNQSGPGGIPPSFGASTPKPPAPTPPPASPVPAPPAPAPEGPIADGPSANEPSANEPSTEGPSADGPTITGPVPPVPPGPADGPEDPASVGWYPSTPTAGPFASPSTPPRRLPGLSRPGTSRPGKSRPGRPAGSGRGALSWGGRGALMNVLLFGAAPLALAGILVAAFVLVAPGKGAASSLGFKAGPAPSTQQLSASALATSSPTPSATPSAHKKKHPRATSSASVPDKTARPRPSASKKATPKPTHKPGRSGGVTPHNLGAPNFNGYCQHIGHHAAEVVAANAYGWRCTLYPALALNAGSVCAWSYHLSTSQVIDVTTNFGDPNAWQCWRVNRYLGPLDFAGYCAQAGLGTSKLVANDAYGWYCTAPSAPVDTTAACDALYHVGNAVSRFTLFANPSSWQCWN